MKIDCAHDELMNVSELRERVHPKNPNKHTEQQIKLLAKILEFTGWRAPIIVSRRTGRIVAGHGRLQAAILNGYEQAPVDFQDFESDEAEIAHLIADNAIAEMSNIHPQQLANLVKKLEEQNFDTELAGIVKKLTSEEPDAELPIVANLQESYDYVLIFTKSQVDFVFLSNFFKLETVRSYKKSGVGIGRVVSFEKFIQAINENRNPVHVASGDNDNTQAAQ